jgi:hypothetical protein
MFKALLIAAASALLLAGCATMTTTPPGEHFGSIGSTVHYTVYNTYGSTLHTNVMTISPTGRYGDNGGCDSRPLAPGGQCTVAITQTTATPQTATWSMTTAEGPTFSGGLP